MNVFGSIMTALALQAPAPSIHSRSAIALPETVREFLILADTLATMGEQGPASPPADIMRLAVQDAAMAYRAALAESAARGDPPAGCPPPPGQAQLALGDLIDDFRSFPEPNRDMPVTTAFALVMTLRYPCEATQK
jgi:hypothetical protein